MIEHQESKRKQGPVTVLALLFGLLLGFSGGGAAPQFDSNTARLGNGEIRLAANARIGTRSGEDRPDKDDAPALLASTPRIVTELVSVRPAATAADAVVPATAFAARFHYHARAPPAA